MILPTMILLFPQRPFHGAAGNDPAKLGMAARLRRETTLPIKVIAARLHLGTSRSANVRLHAVIEGSGAR